MKIVLKFKVEFDEFQSPGHPLSFFRSFFLNFVKYFQNFKLQNALNNKFWIFKLLKVQKQLN